MIARLCPGVRVAIGHGQMDGKQLEKIMMDFINGEYDVLEVGFDPSGMLDALDMQFRETCQDALGNPLEIRGVLHWEEGESLDPWPFA